jgi:hypothetical protein
MPLTDFILLERSYKIYRVGCPSKSSKLLITLLFKLSLLRLFSITVGNCVILFPNKLISFKYGKMDYLDKNEAFVNKFLDKSKLTTYLRCNKLGIYFNRLRLKSIFLKC